MASPNAAPMAPLHATPMTSFYAGQMGQYASSVNDYLPWSIVNLCCGWGLCCILPLIFSIMFKSNKNSNNYSGAQSMSKLALIFNILITIGGAIAWIVVINLVLKSPALADIINKKDNI